MYLSVPQLNNYRGAARDMYVKNKNKKTVTLLLQQTKSDSNKEVLHFSFSEQNPRVRKTIITLARSWRYRLLLCEHLILPSSFCTHWILLYRLHINCTVCRHMSHMQLALIHARYKIEFSSITNLVLYLMSFILCVRYYAVITLKTTYLDASYRILLPPHFLWAYLLLSIHSLW